MNNGIVCISGTSRPGNYTSRALAVVIDELRARGHEPSVLDARDLSLSFPGYPPTPDAQRLQEGLRAATGVVLASPEYHGSMCAMTKLILENLGFPTALADKPVALVGVAAGRIGAIKSLEQLRGACSHVGAFVLPHSVSIAGVQQVFDEDGTCTDEDAEAALRGVAESLLEFIEHYVCPKFTLESIIRERGESWTTAV